MTFFEPNPVFLTFIFAKKFFYLEIIALLAMARVIGSRGPARWAAGTALCLALGGIVTIFAPAMGVTGSPLYAGAARALVWGSGMLALLAVSAVLAASALLPGARWRWIDVLHGLAFLALTGLWIATLV